MAGMNELGGVVANVATGSPPQRVDRNEQGEAKAVEVRQAQEKQDDQSGVKNAVQQASPQAVTEAVNAINNQVQRVSQNLKFSVDHDSGRVVVKVVDGETDKVLRQIPSEEALAISHGLDKMKGLIIEQKA
jgi:flagellar protein FlaG